MRLKFPFPEGAELVREGTTVTVDFIVPEAYPSFEGHFPENPIAPAVTQIAWAKAAMEALLEKPVDGYRLSRFKFIIPIRPLDRIRACLGYEGGKYAYRLFVNGRICCSGFVALVEDD